ncbi:MAG TPA: hypothetical protein VGQ06_02805 [Gemmatimonadales bacterium]|nr:hypothetical protein [Gemmatimonadales bacterium]
MKPPAHVILETVFATLWTSLAVLNGKLPKTQPAGFGLDHGSPRSEGQG